jgi:hypothetical protein
MRAISAFREGIRMTIFQDSMERIGHVARLKEFVGGGGAFGAIHYLRCHHEDYTRDQGAAIE